eukprot:6516351-Pyramimonas_sp.AAC.1
MSQSFGRPCARAVARIPRNEWGEVHARAPSRACRNPSKTLGVVAVFEPNVPNTCSISWFRNVNFQTKLARALANL